MKTISVIVLATLSCALTLSTQAQPNRPERPERPEKAERPEKQQREQTRKGPPATPPGLEKLEAEGRLPPQAKEAMERRKGMRQKMLERFDSDGDGKLSPQERAKARETLARENRQTPRGRMNDEDIERLVERFDKEGDKQLSDEEVNNAREFMEQGRQQRQQRERTERQRTERAKGAEQAEQTERQRPGPRERQRKPVNRPTKE